MTSNRSIHDMWSKFKRSKNESSTSQPIRVDETIDNLSNETPIQESSQNINSQSQVEFNLEEELVVDPGQRPSIMEYDANKREIIRRGYLLKGPNQPMLSKFPQTTIYGEKRNPTQEENEAKQPKWNLPMNWPKAREIDPNKLKNISTQKDTHVIIFSLIHRPYAFCCVKEGMRKRGD